MSSAEFFRVPGICYRARLRYRSSTELDRLASFFYNEVLPAENQVNVLLDLLKLPRTVVEDIISELIRKGYASLNLREGTVQRLTPTREDAVLKDGQYLEVWQDDVTGAFVPTSYVSEYHLEVPPPASTIFAPDARHLSAEAAGDQRARSFLEVADDRIISAVRYLDPSIAMDDGESILDSLDEKERLESLDLYVPIKNTHISELNESIDFVYAAQLPHWVVRAWSAAMRHVKSEAPVSEFALAAAIRQETDLANKLGTLNAAQLASGWHDRFLRLVETRPIPSAESQLFESEHDLRARLIDRIRINDRTRFSIRQPANDATHLSEVWQSARSHVICLLSVWTPADIEMIIRESVGSDDTDTQLVLMPTNQADAEQASNVIHQVAAATIASGRLLFATTTDSRIAQPVCLCDDLELRFLDTAELLSSQSTVVIQDERLVRDVSDRVVQSIIHHDPTRIALQHLRRSQPRHDETLASTPPIVSSVLELGVLLDDATRDYEVALEKARENQRKSDDTRDDDDAAPDAAPDAAQQVDLLSRTCLVERAPELVEQANAIRRDLDEMASSEASVALVGRDSVLDCLLDAADLAASTESSHLQLVVDTASSLALQAELMAKLRRVVARKGRVTFRVARDGLFDVVNEAISAIASSRVAVEPAYEQTKWSIDLQVEHSRFLGFFSLDSESPEAVGIVACLPQDS